MPSPIRFVALGDTQTGSTTGLAPKARVVNAQQSWLLARYRESVKKIIADGPYVLGLGGDLVDGHHHGTQQVWGNSEEQRDAAVELLQPLVNRAVETWGLLGTEAHSGDNGENDRQVYKELGLNKSHIDQHHWLRFGGKVLSWSHHGISVPKSGWIDENGIIAAIRQIEYDYLSGKIEHRPDCLISHDAHLSPKPVSIRGIAGGVAGCWQLPTAYGYNISARRSVDIGFLIWHPETNYLERVLHAQKKIVREVKRG